MSGRGSRATAAAFALLLLLAVALPLAAEQEQGAADAHPGEQAAGGAHDSGEAHDGHSSTFLGMPRTLLLTFNLIVFFGGLGWFVGPVVVRFLDEKQQEIRHSLAEAERQRAETATMESRLLAQLSELRRETAELAARAEREGARERQEILAEAERERARLQAAARGEIESSRQQAQQQLTALAARLASRLAEQRIAAGLGRADRQRIFTDNLARLERRASGGARSEA